MAENLDPRGAMPLRVVRKGMLPRPDACHLPFDTFFLDLSLCPVIVYFMELQPPHRKRCKRWDEPWDAHFLTFSCFRRQRFFSKDRTRLWLLESLGRAHAKHPFDLWGWVIMPEHVHLLILPHEGVKISHLLQSIKQSLSRRAVAYLKQADPKFLDRLQDIQPDGRRTYRFWQRGGGYDRNMRTTRETHEKLDYIHNNPVQCGLVERPEDWPWSSARAWATGKDAPISIDRETFPLLQLTKPWEH